MIWILHDFHKKIPMRLDFITYLLDKNVREKKIINFKIYPMIFFISCGGFEDKSI